MKSTLPSLATLAGLLAAGTADAQFYGTLGAGNTRPDSDNGVLAGASADVDDAWAPTVGIGYRFSPSVFVDLNTGLTASEHTVRLAGLGDVAQLDQRPVTLSVSYQFLTDGAFRPYLTAGYGWNLVSGEKTEGALAGLDIDVEDGKGFVYGVGADFIVNDDWFLRADVKKMDFESAVVVETLGNVGRAEVNPLYFNLWVGYQF